MDKFYAEAFQKGVVSEQLFDAHSIPEDHTINGTLVECRATISQENCQWAKMLSSSYQIQERRNLLMKLRINIVNR